MGSVGRKARPIFEDVNTGTIGEGHLKEVTRERSEARTRVRSFWFMNGRMSRIGLIEALLLESALPSRSRGGGSDEARRSMCLRGMGGQGLDTRQALQ